MIVDRTCRTCRAACAVAVTLAMASTLSCHDAQEPEAGPTPGPGLPPATLAGLVVSDPTNAVVFASLPPGSIPGGQSIVIRTRRTAAQATAPLSDGGLDPVAVAAAAGDTLDLLVSVAGESEARIFAAVVGTEGVPVVVRMAPSAGLASVALETSPLVVFSEPIDEASLTTGSVTLALGSTTVAGTLEFDDLSHLTVRLTPAEPLAPDADYAFRVSADIRDQDGQTLAAAAASAFITQTRQATGGATFVRASPAPGTNSRYVLGAHGSFELQDQSPLFAYRAFTGRYVETGNTITFTFEAWPGWQSAGTLSGDRMTVVYNDALQPSGVTDGVYLMSEDPAPTAPGLIAFASDRTGSSYIYLALPDGSELTRLAGGMEPAWSPDGRWLAYVTLPTSTASIRVMRADGTQQRQLGEGWTPSWSPDGARIVFSTKTAIMVMNADGSGRQELVRLGFPGMAPGSNELSHPSWSPDGSRIAFDSRGGTQPMQWQQVYIMDTDGTNLHPLGSDPFAKSNPSWSPDGTRIAVQTYDYVIGDPSGFDNVLATYDVSSGARAIHYRPHMQWLGYWGPVYSSDGKSLAFTQQLDGFRFRILLVDIATGAYRPFLPEAENPARVGYTDRDPAWSGE
jgi:hypothetical protein